MQVAVEDSARAAAEEAEHGLCQCVREGGGAVEEQKSGTDGNVWKHNGSRFIFLNGDRHSKGMGLSVTFWENFRN